MNTYGGNIPHKIPDLYPDNAEAPNARQEGRNPFGVLNPTENQTLPKLGRVYGYGQPGAVIWIAFDQSEPQIAIVQTDGSWELVLPFGLSEGLHQLKLTHYHSGVNLYKKISFRISTAQRRTFAVLSPAPNDLVDDFYPILHGEATPGDRIEIHSPEGGTASCTATSEGKFALRFSTPLSVGSQTVRVANSSGDRAELTFTVTEPMLVPSEKFTTPILRTTPTPPTRQEPNEQRLSAEVAGPIKTAYSEPVTKPQSSITPTTPRKYTPIKPESTFSADVNPEDRARKEVTAQFVSTTPNADATVEVAAETQPANPPATENPSNSYATYNANMSNTPTEITAQVAENSDNADRENAPTYGGGVEGGIKALSFEEIQSIAAQNPDAEPLTPFTPDPNAGHAVFSPESSDEE